MDVRPTWTDCDEARNYVVPNVLSPRDLVSRPSLKFVTIIDVVNPLLTNGLSHSYHLDESIFFFRGIIFIFYFIFDDIQDSKQNSSRLDAKKGHQANMGKHAEILWQSE